MTHLEMGEAFDSRESHCSEYFSRYNKLKRNNTLSKANMLFLIKNPQNVKYVTGGTFNAHALKPSQTRVTIP
jgi:hypothetical protein